MECQNGEERDNVTENEGERDGCLAQSPSHLHTYLKILLHWLLTVAAFLSKTGQMTHSDYRLIVFSFNKSDERSADQVYSEVSQATEQRCTSFITDPL